mmetsp:Transcript_40856/g.129407  ORF Transcript_40856/g.129407 Transcript_40856/m.129407 type:complete len:737 (+) Transcript_40856:172-2382(+)
MLARPPCCKHRAKKPKGKVQMAVGDPESENIHFVPEPRRMPENGWQMQCADMKMRSAALFNTQMMSDVTLHVDGHIIPVHSFVLASSSPVFYRQLFEDPALSDITGAHVWHRQSVDSLVTDDEGLSGMGATRHLHVYNVPHVAVFEFMHYLYTDDLAITLDNALPLMHLAEEYKVSNLSQKCHVFLKSQVVAKDVLRVLHIAKRMVLGSILKGWKIAVHQKRAEKEYARMSVAQRRRVDDQDVASVASGSRSASTMSFMPPTPHKKRPPQLMQTTPQSARSGMNGLSSPLRTISNLHGDMESLDGWSSWHGDDDASMASPTARRGGGHGRSGQSLAGSGQQSGEAAFSMDLVNKCWKCIRDETEVVIATPEMMDQEINMVVQILRLDPCTAAEISLFRVVLLWAKHHCRLQGLPESAQNMRAVAGEKVLLLIRFGALSAREIQWEVVPSGLLLYDDIQTLLYTTHGRTNQLPKYASEPRSGNAEDSRIAEVKRQQNPSAGHRPTSGAGGVGSVHPLKELVRHIYSSVPHDHIDGLLSIELLRAALLKANDHDAEKSGAKLRKPEANMDRLPAITPRGLTGVTSAASLSSAGSLRAGASGTLVSSTSPRKSFMMTGTPQMAKAPTNLILGLGAVPEEISRASQSREVPLEDPRAVGAESFARIAEGHYIYRGAQLLEVWLEGGVPLCHDHGPVDVDAALQGCGGELDGAAVRQRLGLPPEVSARRHGVHLLAFLQQH